MKLINLIRRACLWFVIWALDVHICDLKKMMKKTNSVSAYKTIYMEYSKSIDERKSAGKEYDSLKSVTWRTA